MGGIDGMIKLLRIMNLINLQTVQTGLADQSTFCNGFDSETRPYQTSTLFNFHSLRFITRIPVLL